MGKFQSKLYKFLSDYFNFCIITFVSKGIVNGLPRQDYSRDFVFQNRFPPNQLIKQFIFYRP